MEMETKVRKLIKNIEDIIYICDADMVISRTDTGVAKCDINLKLADCLEIFGKELIKLGEGCQEHADSIRKKIRKFKESTTLNDKIEFVAEIENPELKRALHGMKTPLPVKKTKSEVTWQTKVEKPPLLYITDSEDEIADETNDAVNQTSQRKKSVYIGNPDTRFRTPKQNNNSEDKYYYACNKCRKVFRTATELRNHVSNHEEEFYTCLKCNQSMRTYKSFVAHRKTHSSGRRYDCEECDSTFTLLSSLTNHMQKHSNEFNVCRKCKKKFKYRQKYLDHIQFKHLPTKTIKCPMCSKMFQTKGSFAQHKYKKHGDVRKLVKGYSLVPTLQQLQ